MTRPSRSHLVLLAALPLGLLLTACGEDTSGAGAPSGGGAAGSSAGANAGGGTSGAGGTQSGNQGGASGGKQGGAAGVGQAGQSGAAGAGQAGQSGAAGTGQAGQSGGAGHSGAAGAGHAGNGGAAGLGAAGNAGTAGQGGGAGSPGESVPSTCEQAHGLPGCCSADGKTLYYFGEDEVKSLQCPEGYTCGWSEGVAGYYCLEAAPEADPKGKYPLACSSPVVGIADGCDGAPSSGCTKDKHCSATPKTPLCDPTTLTCRSARPETCDEAHGSVGCCSADGRSVYWWLNGKLDQRTCWGDNVCTWQGAYYDCSKGPQVVDPEGAFPALCTPTAPVDLPYEGCEHTCATSADCGVFTKAPHCDLATESCVGCLTSSDCKDPERPICNAVTKRCGGCDTSFDCKDPAKPACDAIARKCTVSSQCTGADLNEDANDGPSGAVDITPTDGNTKTVTGHAICGLPALEADHFEIVVQDGDELTLSLTWAADADADLDLEVSTADGALLAVDYFRSPAKARLRYLAGGTYDVMITRYDGKSPQAAGTPYTLDVTRTPGPKCASTADCLADSENTVARANCTPTGTCVFVQGAGKIAKDELCDSNDDCASGLCALAPFSTNAAAFAFCSDTCWNGDADCAGDRVCTTVFQKDFCTAKCTEDSDCHTPFWNGATPGQTWTQFACNVSTGRCVHP